jgi:hypothetical protein
MKLMAVRSLGNHGTLFVDVPLLSLMNLEGINVLKLGDFEDDLKKSLLEMKYTNYYRSSCFTVLILQCYLLVFHCYMSFSSICLSFLLSAAKKRICTNP